MRLASIAALTLGGIASVVEYCRNPHRERDAVDTPPGALAGCYVFYFGEPLHWQPTAFSHVDTAHAMRLRVRLETTRDSSGLTKKGYNVRPNRFLEVRFVWWPTRRGIHLVNQGVDTRDELILTGTPASFSGGSRTEGMVVGAPYRQAVIGHRVSCDGFSEGVDVPDERRPALTQ